MAECGQLLILVIIVFGDISVATLTTSDIWGEPLKRVDFDVSSYSFATSTIEFWFFAVIRSAMLSGAIIGRMLNKRDSQQRLQYTWPATIVAAVLMMMFAVVKMLAYTEVNLPSALFWCQFAWMLVASVTFHAGFVVLRKLKNVNNLVVNTSINTENDEQHQPLLSDSSTEEISSSSKTNHVSVVLRLLSYSKPDAHLIVTAFLFMVICAVCKYISYRYHFCCVILSQSNIFLFCPV